MKREIEWVSLNDVLFTSVVVWNQEYIPYQIMVFLNQSNNCELYVNRFGMISRYNYEILKMRTNTLDEALFNITFHAKNILDSKNESNFKGTKGESNDTLEFLFTLFMRDYQMDYIKNYKNPDFGFYSLALNFDIIKDKLHEFIQEHN